MSGLEKKKDFIYFIFLGNIIDKYGLLENMRILFDQNNLYSFPIFLFQLYTCSRLYEVEENHITCCIDRCTQFFSVHFYGAI